MCPLRYDDGLSLGGFDPPPPTFCWLARFHYASMTFTSLCGFDPHPPTVVGTHPLRYNDSFDIYHSLQYVQINLNDFLPNWIYYHFSDMCPFIFRFFLRTYPSQTSLCPSS